MDKNDGIAKITINRHKFGNAFALNTYTEFELAIEECEADESIKVVVVTGEGKNFSAGGDINNFKKCTDDRESLPKAGVLAAWAMSDAVKRCPKPVPAIINGAVASAGCSLAFACDFKVMAPKSKLVMAFINMGYC